MESKRVVIVGAGEHGRMMNNFLQQNTDYEVMGFAVEHKYRKDEKVDGLPVTDFENIVAVYPPLMFQLFIAVTFVNLNRERMRLFNTVKSLGYHCISYVDPSSKVDRHAVIGENVAIFENNIIQYKAVIGDNVVMQAGGY